MQIQKQLTPRFLFTGLGVAAFSALVLTTIVPVMYWLPVSVTESSNVIARTDAGCVVQTRYGDPFVVSGCSASPGQVITYSYAKPAMADSAYMQRVHARADYVVP